MGAGGRREICTFLYFCYEPKTVLKNKVLKTYIAEKAKGSLPAWSSFRVLEMVEPVRAASVADGEAR